jgi:23S rRNA (uracil1939-C5)-methyltransferase
LDPPREGCPEWALRLIARKIRPERIIDVSCDPRSLGRDLATLTQSGYRVMEIQPIDMFPHTSHIESIALLIRSR